MSKNAAIEIFVRVRPTKRASPHLNLLKDENQLEFFIPRDKAQGYVNNQKEAWKFDFNELFGMETKQEDIFEHIAKDVINSALEGYNGTIFAYGQTGSGKTYTMTGGAERYADRGIIPRTISYIFNESKKRSDTFFEVSISYIEIYNNEGYDLLDENHTTRQLQDLPKVIPRDTGNDQIILSGLSVHKAQSEEDALNLLFIGDTNRVVSETPKNDASTRSHCIFIVQIESKRAGSDVKTVSRLHLVDLSGSERIGKTGVEGKLLKEATHINLSLHYLEHVIITLNKKMHGEDVFVPYRNSLMTLVLRDSLGGNCMTRMIATISAEEPDIDESICTCKFAQRVAMIKNSVSRNEAVDPALIIERLKKENAELKAELALLRGGGPLKEMLDPNEIEECKKMVEEYIGSRDPGKTLVLSDRLKINECFYHFKHLYKDIEKRAEKGGLAPKGDSKWQDKGPAKSDESTLQLEEEVKRLKLLVQQRDNEIMILLNMIKKQKPGEQGLALPVTRDENSSIMAGAPAGGDKGNLSTLISGPGAQSFLLKESIPISFPQYQKDQEKIEKEEREAESTPRRKLNIKQGGLNEPTTAPASEKNAQLSKEVQEVNSMLTAPLTNLTNAQLMDRAGAFELFRKSYRRNEAMEESKMELKDKFDKGKQLGQLVNDARNKINEFKNRIEMLRKEKALQGLLDNMNELRADPEEERLQNEIERQKMIYKTNFEALRELKGQIEGLQNHLEKSRIRMQQDFERWIGVMLNQKNINVSMSNDLSTITNYLEAKKPSNIKDEEVRKNLQEFYKAKEQLEKNSQAVSNNFSGNQQNTRSTGMNGSGYGSYYKS